MKHPVKLIAIDLDGTLLDSNHQLPARNREAIQRAVDAGIHVVIATGRPRWSGYSFAQELNLQTPGVYLQGLNIHAPDGTLLHERLMEPETARRVLEYALANGLSVMAYNRERVITRESNILTAQMQKYGETVPHFEPDMLSVPGRHPISKFVFVDDPARAEEIRRGLIGVVRESASVFLSQPNLIEVLPPGASKGGGLKMVLDDMGILAANVLAIGDGENDIEMIELAGIGVAMGNATPHLKAVADYITGTNDEAGVAQAIERFAL